MNADRRRVVIAGAGVAGLETTLALRALAADLVAVQLVAPEREFVYRPLSVAEPFGAGEVRRFPLDSLASAAGATLTRGAAEAVDTESKRLVLTGGNELDYDVLVLTIGGLTREAIVGA